MSQRVVPCRFLSLVVLVLAATAGLIVADPNDWVNVDYVLKQGNDASTSDARQDILSKAGTSAKSGPWSVVDMQGIAPPSGDAHDYLSWAPYHWPMCNWCSKGTNHLSGPNPGNHTDDDDTGDDGSDNGDDFFENGGFDSESVDVNGLFAVGHSPMLPRGSFHRGHNGMAHSRMIRRRRDLASPAAYDASGSSTVRQEDLNIPDSVGLPSDAPAPPDGNDVPSIPTDSTDVGGLPTMVPGSQSTTTDNDVYGTQAPAQAPAKTSTSHSKTSCTPSPTKSLAPSATWTTCPYEVRDGKVNPDVRTLPDSPAVVDMSQSVLFNALAYATQKTKVYSQNAAKFIDAWFLNSSTAMNPNMNFGQQVRGPGKAHQMGTFTGILDIRGLVKVVNAIMLLQSAGSPDWTPARDKAMTAWMKSYITWLENSAIGKSTSSKANNHLSFFVSQLAAAKMYAGDKQGAQTVLKNYFNNQFLDQIAASGEQPFEAVRTRPYHYRAFNLEAMITNAKIGDQLGMNLWVSKSKYGATIQTALDFVMGLDPKDEDISDVFPHVAAVAAAYGDPKGKYAAFLKKNLPSYTSQPFWFYDQRGALPNSPADRTRHRREFDLVEDDPDNMGNAIAMDTNTEERMVEDTVNAAASPEDTINFQCPGVYAEQKYTELEFELYVTCEDLRPFYELIPRELVL